MTSRGLTLDSVDVTRAGRRVVQGVTVSVQPGEITAMLGPNGAGKTSTVLALAGVLPTAGGRIAVDGVDLTNASPDVVRRAGVAVVPEGHRVLGDLTVEENLRVATAILPRRGVDAALDGVLETFVELRPMLGRSAGLLSGGQQQMLALAQALAPSPRYLVIDELSFGLAPVIVRRLAAALRGVAAAGTGVLLIEQFTEVALDLAVQATVLRGGRVRFAGPAAQLRDQPDILQAAYLAEDNRDGAAQPFETRSDA